MAVGVMALAAAIALVVLVIPASAAFEGRNGLIAYSTGGGEEDHVVRTIKPDGTQHRRVIGPRTRRWPLPFPRGLSLPQWSADGKRLLLGGHHHYDRGAQSLWYSTASGKRVTRIPLRLGGVGKGPSAIYLFGWSWAPDGRHVVFAAGRRFELSTIYTIRIDGKRRRAVRRGSWPQWSGDGGHIAFERRGLGDTSYIFVVKPNGGGLRRLTQSDRDSSPSFSPDGRKVLFVRSATSWPAWRDEWRTVDVTGDNDVLITAREGIWPSRYQYCPPQWTPDGTRLAVTRIEYLPNDRTTHALVTVSPQGDDEQVAFTFPHPYLYRMCDFSWQPR